MAWDPIPPFLGQALGSIDAETEQSRLPEPQGAEDSKLPEPQDAEERRSPGPQGADGG